MPRKDKAKEFFERRESNIEGLLQSMMLLELSVMVGEREGREPKRVVENAKRYQRRHPSPSKTILRILAEKEQPYSIYPNVNIFLVELRFVSLRTCMEMWPWIAEHEAEKFA